MFDIAIKQKNLLSGFVPEKSQKDNGKMFSNLMCFVSLTGNSQEGARNNDHNRI